MQALRRNAFALVLAVAIVTALVFALRGSDKSADSAPVAPTVSNGAPVESSVASAPSVVPPAPPPTSVLPIDPQRVLDKPPTDRPKCEGLEFVDSYEGQSHTRGCIVRKPGGKLVREGPWTMIDGQGWTSAGAMKDDMKEGRWTRWYPSGKVASIEEWSADQRNGLQIEWDESGARVRQRTWKAGLLDGEELAFMPDGSTVRRWWKHGVESK